jgi:hypothetical protein
MDIGPMAFGDFGDLLKMMMKAHAKKRISKEPIVNLSPEHIAQFQEIMARAKALGKEMDAQKKKWEVRRSQISAMVDRWTADVKDIYKLHDKRTHFNPETISFHSVLEDDDTTTEAMEVED